MSPEERARFLDQPAGPPPPGIESNLENPKDFERWLLPVQIVLFIFLTLLVLAWTFTRLKFAKKIAVEDYLIFLGYLQLIILYTFTIIMTRTHLGAHMWDITVRTRIKLFRFYYDCVISYSILVVTIKSGIILQIIRTFVPAGTRNYIYWTGHVLIGINVLFYFANLIVELKTCTPRAKQWDPTIEGGTCANVSAVRAVVPLINVISDLIIMILPLRVIWGLSLPLKRKLKISVLFLFGIFSMACGCVQIYLGVGMSESKRDKSYKLGLSAVWATLEVAGGFLVACLPLMPKFFGFLRHSAAGSHLSSTVKSVLKRSADDNRDTHKSWHKEKTPRTIGSLGKRQRGPSAADHDYDDLMRSRDSDETTKRSEDSFAFPFRSESALKTTDSRHP